MDEQDEQSKELVELVGVRCPECGVECMRRKMEAVGATCFSAPLILGERGIHVPLTLEPVSEGQKGFFMYKRLHTALFSGSVKKMRLFG